MIVTNILYCATCGEVLECAEVSYDSDSVGFFVVPCKSCIKLNEKLPEKHVRCISCGVLTKQSEMTVAQICVRCAWGGGLKNG